MARSARLALADARALEKEGERQNPISEVRGGNYADIGKKAVALHRAEHRLLGHGTEAHYQGYALGNHLRKLHGGAYHHAFTEGVMGAGYDESDSEREGDMSHDKMKRSVGGATTGAYEGEGMCRGRGRKPEDNPVGFGIMEKARALKKPGVSYKQPPGMLDAHSVGMKGGASGGRKPSKRNEVVKKVMRDKGMSMIEASKYVKANGLY